MLVCVCEYVSAYMSVCGCVCVSERMCVCAGTYYAHVTMDITLSVILVIPFSNVQVII